MDCEEYCDCCSRLIFNRRGLPSQGYRFRDRVWCEQCVANNIDYIALDEISRPGVPHVVVCRHLKERAVWTKAIRRVIRTKYPAETTTEYTNIDESAFRHHRARFCVLCQRSFLDNERVPVVCRGCNLVNHCSECEKEANFTFCDITEYTRNPVCVCCLVGYSFWLYVVLAAHTKAVLQGIRALQYLLRVYRPY